MVVVRLNGRCFCRILRTGSPGRTGLTVTVDGSHNSFITRRATSGIFYYRLDLFRSLKLIVKLSNVTR